MFLVDWLYAILAYLGLLQKEANILFLGLDNTRKTTVLHMLKHERLVQHQPARFLLKELIDYAWHYALNFREHKFAPTVRNGYYAQGLVQHQPTQLSISEEFSIGKIKFKAFDLGGHQIAGRVWKDYYAQVDAVVYLVDVSDMKRFAESKTELDALLSDESLANVPFLILGVDRFSSQRYGVRRDVVPLFSFMHSPTLPFSEYDLIVGLTLRGFTTGKGKVIISDSNVRPLEVFSIRRKRRCKEAFEWLSQYI